MPGVDAYLAQIVHVRVRLTWLRYCDYRPDTFGLIEIADPF